MADIKEIIDWIQLINSEQVGLATFYKLLETYHTAAAALEALPRFKKIKMFPRREAQLEAERARELGIKILLHKDPEYPENLRQIDDAPPVLYVKGDLRFLNYPLSVSIVGARNATINGRKTASRIAYELTHNQIMIISGMARGIDTAAHKGAMYALNQQGPTVAVLGTGVDVVYPQENKMLYAQIVEQGAVVSEFPLGTQPQATNFPRRNRIVAALSQGTLVVEATLNSGSLITARMALEQGKDIFAIPGAPGEGRSAGPNKLIKDGAVLVENSDDVLQVLCANNHDRVQKQLRKPSPPKTTLMPELDLIEIDTNLCPPETSGTKIIDYLNRDGVYVDEIIRASGLDAAVVSLELLELEMDGRIIRQAGNKVALTK